MHDTIPSSTSSDPPEPLPLSLGQLTATSGAIRAMAKAGHDPLEFLCRHRKGDWGDVDAQDHKANEDALVTGDRVLSAYVMKDGTRLWVMTEADRSSTCILLPEEY